MRTAVHGKFYKAATAAWMKDNSSWPTPDQAAASSSSKGSKPDFASANPFAQQADSQDNHSSPSGKGKDDKDGKGKSKGKKRSKKDIHQKAYDTFGTSEQLKSDRKPRWKKSDKWERW